MIDLFFSGHFWHENSKTFCSKEKAGKKIFFAKVAVHQKPFFLIKVKTIV